MRIVLAISMAFLLLSGLASPQEPPAKDNKEEVLYKGKPASFWISQLKDRDASFRLEAVKGLREIGTDGEGVAVALMKTFADKEKEVRDAARSAFDSLPVEGRVTALVQVLRGKEKALRPAAIDLLGGIGTKARDAVPDLSKALEDEDAAVRSGAAKALGKIGTPEKSAVAALVKVLDDKETPVRLEAARALGVVGKGSEPAITSLQGKLAVQKEEDPSTRLELVKALVKIGKENDSVLAAFLVACNDPDESVRKEARAALASVDMKRRVPTCVQALKATDTKTRLVALQLLAEIGEPAKTAAPAVVEILKSDDETLRLQAVKVLSKVGPDAEATSALIGLLEDKSPRVRLEAVRAFGRQSPLARDAVLPLNRTKKGDTDDSVRTAANEVLRKCRPQDLIPVWIEELGSKSASDRRTTAEILCSLGFKARIAAPSLRTTLKDSDPQTRIAAACALTRMDEVEIAMPVLIDGLQHEDEKVRLIAATALGWVGPDAKSAVKALDAALSLPGSEARLAVIAALGNIGPDARATVFNLILVSKEKDLLPAVLQALEQIGTADELAVALLLQLLKGDAETQRRAVALIAAVGPSAKDTAITLRRLLDNKDDLRDPAAYALCKIGAADKTLVDDYAKELPKAGAYSYLLAEMGPEAKAAVPALCKLIGTASEEKAVWALGRIGLEAKEAAPALKELMKNSSDWIVPPLGRSPDRPQRSSITALLAAEALWRIEKKQADVVPALRSLITAKDTRMSVRLEAAAVLWTIQQTDSDLILAHLRQALKSDERGVGGVMPAWMLSSSYPHRPMVMGVRRQAAQLVQRIGPAVKGILPDLIELSDHPDALVRVEVDRAIRRLRENERAARVWTEKLKDKNTAVRLQAARALAWNDAEGVALALTIAFLSDKEQNVSEQALASLIFLPKEMQVVALLDAATAEDAQLRQAAMRQLNGVCFNWKEAVPALIGALKGKDDKRRVIAAQVAGMWGPSAHPAVPPLIELLGHKDASVRREAVVAVQNLTSPVQGQPAGPFYKHPYNPLNFLPGTAPGSLSHPRMKEVEDSAEILLPVLVKALEDKDAAMRRLAAMTISFLGEKGRDAVPALVKATRDEDQNVSISACFTLRKLGPAAKDAVDDLAKNIKEGKQAQPFLSLYALAGAGEHAKKASPLLNQLLKKTNQAPFRVLAAEALLGITPDDKEALSALVEVVKDKGVDTLHSKAAVFVLAQSGKAGITAIHDSLTDTASLTLGMQALVEVGEAKAAAPLVERGLKNKATQQQALTALVAIGLQDRQALAGFVPALIEIAKDKKSASRVQAIGFLRFLGPEGREALPMLIDALGDEDNLVSGEAILALMDIGPDAHAAIPAVLEMMKKEKNRPPSTPYTIPRIPAVTCLPRIAGPKAKEHVPALIAALKVVSDHRLVEALGNIGPDAKAVCPHLKTLLKDDSRQTRVAAAGALSQIDPKEAKEALPVLIEALDDTSARLQAIQALGRIGSGANDAIPHLEKLLKETKAQPGGWPVEYSQVYAAEALWRIQRKPHAILPVLVKVVQRQKDVAISPIGAHACRILGDMGSQAKAAVPVLVEAVNGQSPPIRLAAGEALKKIDPEAASKAGVK